ncbi:MAG: methyltransferase domain-containing protein [Candidatus Aminicenantes bacterium]|nr:methyltransferase domain-containing protein [Candidatus Aminicenantes bacterium]NIM78857.1 methyltransferase domain-containing protein [Candidatus Aminicenantes bacterium]NIN18113.1 methyltransferase domain-containing protein [Candidatus Aminicenantes bacterium]NIN42012.1 methyltransferase domain-containing protein [Candidatus Aminicenantes bacterium]NIN84768.1 methyltransferase domain-containing protein [Candidatus Aminicenantes bacterium]
MFRLTRYYNWLIFSIINPALKERLPLYVQGKLLDIGCGEKPYLEMASPYVTGHIGIDRWDTYSDKSNIDIFSTAYEIPCKNESFDSVLCTDVLEHLKEPGLALAEAYRILKPGGFGIYTVPLFWHLHEEPYDYYRFTRYGLKYLFEKNGFEVVEIKALSGFCAAFGQELAYFLNGLRKGGKLNPLWWIIPPFVHLVQGAAYLLNKIDLTERFSVEYIAVIKKPSK